MLLKATKREITGKKVSQLRRAKKLPAVLYGPNRESTNITIDPLEFKKLFKDVGYSKLFDLDLEGDKVKVLVKDLQANTLTDEFTHIDLYQVNMKKEITAEIPLTFVGESFAVKNNIGLLVHPLQSVSVTCLPSDLPASLEVSIDGFNEIGDSVTVADIKLPEGVEIANDVASDSPVAYIAAPQKTIEEETPEEVVEEDEETEGEESKEKGSEETKETKEE
ncbi:MAG TPA: 50S ribosomal protein L25 [Candidatus Dojkabacteria bacterium]|nr:50S ribosomal protein L25 [Candidatus Dojkabacteria bacterium]HRP37327.1 50S ribosomal protein L25 [Candidatus Dojkabacteria bacterium]HRP51813.1 50S ribosomal protein L25 [Candidatus Dojkabacteria bacterium]